MRILLLITLSLFVTGPVLAGGDEGPDEGELLPGLAARYVAGEATIQRIDPDVHFVWR
jgi:hypothetical protein